MDISPYVEQIRRASEDRPPKNTLALAKLLKSINDYPDKSVEKYCQIAEVHYSSFFRYVSKLRELGLLHPRYYKLINPVKETAPPVAKTKTENFVPSAFLGNKGTSRIEDLAITIANSNPDDVIYNFKTAKEFVTILIENKNEKTDHKFRSWLAAYAIIFGKLDMYKGMSLRDPDTTWDEMKSELGDFVGGRL